MPIYVYRCNECGKEQDAFRKIADRNNCPECCGQQTEKIITGQHAVHADLEPYLDENMAEKPVYVKSKQHKEKLMREHNVTPMFGKNWL